MDLIVRTLWGRIRREWKLAFFSAFAIGMLTHAFVMTNNLLTTDSMWNLISDQDMISSGRQFLTYVFGISSDYYLPWLNGLLTILYLSAAAVLFAEAFEIRSPILIILTAAFTVTFPAVAATFAFSYTADGYALGIVLSVFAFLICDRTKYGFMAASVILGISLGIYQSYYSVTVLLCVFSLMIRILRKESFKDLWNRIWRYLFMGGAAYLLYLVSLRVMLNVKATALSGYQGTDRVFSFEPAELIEGMIAALKAFFRFFVDRGYYFPVGIMGGFFLCFFAAAVCGYLVLFWKNKIFSEPWRIFLSIVLLASAAIGACLPVVLFPDVYFHMVMRYPMIVVLLFAAAVLSEWEKNSGNGRWIRLVGSAAALALCFQYMVVSNIAYFNLNEKYEKSYAICIELVNRIHGAEGYTPDMPVAILGGDPNRAYYPWSDQTGNVLGYVLGTSGDFVVNSSSSYAEFCRHYLGTKIVTQSLEEDYGIVNTEEFNRMGYFPEADGMRIINGVLVIKMGG